MQIAEDLIPYFKSQIKDEFGNTARFASIQDVEFDQILLAEINNIHLKVKVLSDQGAWTHDLIIREFKDLDKLNREIERYNELERRCILFENIFPAPLINVDKNNRQLIYEKNTGLQIDKIEFTNNLKDYQLGKIFAMIQGEKSNPLDASTMKELLEYVLSTLPFTEDERTRISMLLEPHYYILPNSLGGYVPCTLFDPTTIEVNKLSDITRENIDDNKALYLTIPIQIPESNIVDRMADIASYYIEETYKEFCTTGSVHNTKEKIYVFFEGYNSVAKQINMPTMKELYKHGITLDIQMLLIFWIMILSKIGSGENVWSKDVTRFTYFILLKKPFLLF